MNNLLVKDDIGSMIYAVRGKNVILDSDIAKLFGVETKRINETVRNNQAMFFEFVFKINENEYETISKLQIVTLNTASRSTKSTLKSNSRGQNIKYPHKAFTREGVAILGSIMRGEKVKYAVEEILYVFDKLENKNSLIIKGKNIQDMIYEINGIQVILDSDLAYLYECKNGTKEINQAVKNNLEKFPERFSWVLTNEEKSHLWSKFLTANISNMSRSNPRVFTEQGVVMLATILHTKEAIETSIRIVDAFVVMKHYLNQNGDIYKSITYLNNKVIEHDNKIDLLLSKFDYKEKIFIKGQEYEAYSTIFDIFSNALNELIIINSYADKTLLDLITSINCKIILITSKKSKLTIAEIEKFNKEYNKLKVIYSDNFHDRYFIIDRNEIYLSGASINYAGSKVTTIDKLKDKCVKDVLLNEIDKIIKLSEK